jgi:hypothetical protein
MSRRREYQSQIVAYWLLMFVVVGVFAVCVFGEYVGIGVGVILIVTIVVPAAWRLVTGKPISGRRRRP